MSRRKLPRIGIQREEEIAVGSQFLQEQPGIEGDQVADDLVQADFEGPVRDREQAETQA